MTPEIEQKLLTTLYKRLWEAITQTPNPSQPTIFNSTTNFLQISPGEPINPTDFANALTPNYPNGNLKAAEVFSRIVDEIPAIKANFKPTYNRVSSVYRQILQSANSNLVADPNLQQIYEQAQNYLNSKVTIQDWSGNKTTIDAPSEVAQKYEHNKIAYLQALSNYQTAYLNYDLNDPRQQRQWQAEALLLKAAIDQAYNKWRREGAAQVEQAQMVINKTVRGAANSERGKVLNAALQTVIQEAQQSMNTYALQSGSEDGSQWYLSYGLPTNWIEIASGTNLAPLEVKSSYLEEQPHPRFNKYNGGSAWEGGLWSVRDIDSKNLAHYHLQATELQLSAKLGIVHIYRPWCNQLVWKMSQSFVDALNNTKPSPGNDHSTFLLIPTAFIVARDVKITANFTSEDRLYLQQSLSGDSEVGIGPFRLSGRYSHSLSSDTFHSTNDGDVVNVAGVHILAWVSEIFPLTSTISL
ncbi:MAG: hypothetical protein VKL59_21740 [Nostocaceae cyanobacterium]|nr:hypothetical protein [Nostocaceae cyanobacterium]